MPTSYRRRLEKNRLKARERSAQRRMLLEQTYLSGNVSSGNANDGALWNLPASSSNTALPSSIPPEISNEENRCSQVCGIKVEQELIEKEGPFQSLANNHEHTSEVTNEGAMALWEEEIPVNIPAVAQLTEEEDPLALPDGERYCSIPGNNKESDEDRIIVKTEPQPGEAPDFGTTSDEDNAMMEEAEIEATTVSPVFPLTSKGNFSSVNGSVRRRTKKPNTVTRNMNTSAHKKKSPSNISVGGSEKKSYQLRRCRNSQDLIAEPTLPSSLTHICLICDETLSSSFKLDEHYIHHSIRREIQCQICQRIFPTFRDLRIHVNDYYLKNLMVSRLTDLINQFQCPICDISFVTKLSLDCHGRTHEVDDLVCKICVQSFPSFNTLVSHIKRHKSHTYRCIICNQNYKELKTVIRHASEKHQDVHETCCEFCEEKFKTPEDLEVHKEQFHASDIKWVNKFEGREIEKLKKMKNAVSSLESKSFLRASCQRCGKTVQKRDMKKHQRSITCRFPLLPVPCQICGEKFRGRRTLEAHQQRHLGFQCPFCPSPEFRYAAKPGLLRHLAVSHLKAEGFVELNVPSDAERKYACKKCNARYTTSVAVKEHELYHGIPAFECPDCPQKFFTNYQLFGHKMKEHGRYWSGLRKGQSIMCHQCPSTFISRPGYLRHMRAAHSETPNSFLCEVCGKSFKFKDVLSGHVRGVHGNK